MNKPVVEQVVRYLLVVMLAVFGANMFLHFMPQPAPPDAGGKFLGALGGAGYVFPTIGIVFLIAVVLLMSRCVVLALLLVAPIAVNILSYHFRYDLAGTGAGGLLAVLMLVLAVIHARDVAVLFRPGLTLKRTESARQ